MVFPIGPLRSLARKPVRRPALLLRLLLASADSSRELPCPFLLRAASLPYPLLSARWRTSAEPAFSARRLLVSPFRFSVYKADVLRFESKDECAQDPAAVR